MDRYMFVGGINRLLNENLAENNLEEYSKREPDDFLNVMGTVVNNNWRTALVRLGTKVGKYSKILADYLYPDMKTLAKREKKIVDERDKKSFEKGEFLYDASLRSFTATVRYNQLLRQEENILRKLKNI